MNAIDIPFNHVLDDGRPIFGMEYGYTQTNTALFLIEVVNVESYVGLPRRHIFKSL